MPKQILIVMLINQRQLRKFLIWMLVSCGLLIAIACSQQLTTKTAPTPAFSTANIAFTQKFPAKPIPRSLFGMHISMPSQTIWPQIPFASWRLWDTGGIEKNTLIFWPHLERFPNKWDFSSLDKYVELAPNKGVEIVYVLGLTPKWASARPTDSSAYGESVTPAEPKNLEDWRNAVRTIATRYQGKIHYYEIWNEPNLKSYYSGTIDQMVALNREAYKILKQIDPKIQVISPSIIAGNFGWLTKGGADWLDEYFTKGGAAYTDIVGAHFYQEVPNLPPEVSLPQIQELQKVMAKHGLAKKPLWNTETGFGNKQHNVFFSERESMDYVARSYLVNWAAGIERFYWYAWDNRMVITLLMVEEDGKTLTAAGKAFGEIQQWLIGADMKSCEIDGDRTWICQLVRGSENNFWIVWNPERELTFKIPAQWQIRQFKDLTGRQTPLSQSGDLSVGKSPLLLSP